MYLLKSNIIVIGMLCLPFLPAYANNELNGEPTSKNVTTTNSNEIIYFKDIVRREYLGTSKRSMVDLYLTSLSEELRLQMVKKMMAKRKKSSDPFEDKRLEADFNNKAQGMSNKLKDSYTDAQNSEVELDLVVRLQDYDFDNEQLYLVGCDVKPSNVNEYPKYSLEQMNKRWGINAGNLSQYSDLNCYKRGFGRNFGKNLQKDYADFLVKNDLSSSLSTTQPKLLGNGVEPINIMYLNFDTKFYIKADNTKGEYLYKKASDHAYNNIVQLIYAPSTAGGTGSSTINPNLKHRLLYARVKGELKKGARKSSRYIIVNNSFVPKSLCLYDSNNINSEPLYCSAVVEQE